MKLDLIFTSNLMINDHSCWALVQTKIHFKRKKRQEPSSFHQFSVERTIQLAASIINKEHLSFLSARTIPRSLLLQPRAIHNNQHKQPGITTLGLLLLHHHHHQYFFFVFSFFSTILLLLLLLPLTTYTMTANSTVQNYRAELSCRMEISWW